jgi:hypothetical protein
MCVFDLLVLFEVAPNPPEVLIGFLLVIVAFILVITRGQLFVPHSRHHRHMTDYVLHGVFPRTSTMNEEAISEQRR